jgi:FMN phosphatase YigB (HAD superfamily)
MAEGVFDPGPLKAIIFDLDGTLYQQAPVRRTMLLRLLRAHATRPLSGLRTLRVLRAYRQAQEHLRASMNARPLATGLADAQLLLAAERAKVSPDIASGCVARWMEQEPLDLLAHAIRPGLRQFLEACKARGVRLGVLSDYPADAKVDALGLHGWFDVVLAAQSPGVGVFKPHPRGLLLAMDRLQASADESLYVGDRADVDGTLAAAAGVRCFILRPRVAAAQPTTWTPFTGYPELQEALFGPRRAASVAAQPTLDFR